MSSDLFAVPGRPTRMQRVLTLMQQIGVGIVLVLLFTLLFLVYFLPIPRVP